MARKEKNIHYIYKTTCNVTKKWYIGMHSASNLDDGYMGSGKILRYSIRKYGADNHTKEILEYCESREVLVLRETEIVNSELISDGFCMNLKEGGQGGGKFYSIEQMMNCSKAGNEVLKYKFANDKEFRDKFVLKAKNRILIGELIPEKTLNYDWNGKSHSEETKTLMSEKSKGTGTGEANSQYGTCWITKDGVCKKVKKEEIEIWTNEGWEKGRKL